MTWTNTFNFWLVLALPYIAGMLLRASAEPPAPDWLAGLITVTTVVGFCLAWWFSRSLGRALIAAAAALYIGFHELLWVYLIFTPILVILLKKPTPPSLPPLSAMAPRDPPLRNWGR